METKKPHGNKGTNNRPIGYKHKQSTIEKFRLSKIGSKNHQWVEKSPSYSSVHKWLARNFTKLSECEFCGSDRFIEWALKTGLVHDHIRDNYLCLCSSCHKKYDYTPEKGRKMSESLKKAEYNTNRSPEWRKMISEKLKGRCHLTEQHKQNLRELRLKNPLQRDGSGRFIKRK